MKNLLAICLIFFLLPVSAQNWTWARSSQPGSYGEGTGAAVDQGGNVFICGSAQGSPLTFGSYTLSNGTYVVKYDPAGNLLWARGHSGSGRALATDWLGNCYETGTFYSATLVAGTFTLFNNGASTSDTYLIKYDAAGNVMWATSGGSANTDISLAVACDIAGNAIIAGTSYSGTAVWGTSTVNVPQAYTAFAAKYNSSGQLMWVVTPNAVGANVGSAVAAVMGPGDVYLAGKTGTTALSYGTATVSSLLQYYVVKLSASGIAQWAVSSSGSGNSQISSLSCDAAGNLYAGGVLSGSNMAIGSQTFNSGSSPFSFVTKYNAGGSALWTNTISVTGTGMLYSLAAHGSGVFVAGSCGSSVNFGGNTYTVQANEDPMYLARYSAGGIFQGANLLLSGGDDEMDVACNGPCTAYVGGDFRPAVFTVGTNTLINTQYPSEGIFVAQYSMGSQISIVGTSSSVICPGETATLSVTNATSVTWSNGSTLTSIYVSPTVSTNYSVSGISPCGYNSAVATVTVLPAPQLSITASSSSVCSGNSVTLTATGAISYTWSGGNINNTAFWPVVSQTYTVTGIATSGCLSRDSIYITVIPTPNAAAFASPQLICAGSSSTLNAVAATAYTWLPGGSNSPSITVSPLTSSTYTVLKANATCTNLAVVNVTIKSGPPLVVTPPSPTICTGEPLLIFAQGAVTYTWTGFGNVPSISVSPTAATVYTVSGTGSGTPACISTQTVIVQLDNCTAIGVQQTDHALTVQASGDELRIKIPDYKTPLQLYMYDMNGNLVLSKILSAENCLADISALNGLCIYQIWENNGNIRVSGKIAISH